MPQKNFNYFIQKTKTWSNSIKYALNFQNLIKLGIKWILFPLLVSVFSLDHINSHWGIDRGYSKALVSQSNDSDVSSFKFVNINCPYARDVVISDWVRVGIGTAFVIWVFKRISFKPRIHLTRKGLFCIQISTWQVKLSVKYA